MPEVVNPAVIIGLGGTGKWVLTYVKKNLLDTYGGEMPKTVRLLSFDTTSEKISRDGVPQEEDARVGNVQLDKQAEFVYLGGNIQQICREVRDEGRHPHIRSWLQARTYLQTADSDAFDISRGAGQKRPFGRMAIFYDLQQLVQSRIINKIETALAEVLDANSRQAPVEIYIVASLAGGTGAGMFIDVAHLTRWFANRQIRSGFAIRGFLALQNTFRSVIKTEHVQPQVFAAMRELDRFMLVFDQHYPMIYNPTTQDLNTIYGGQLGKLFDNCYLLDASREQLPLDGFEPKYGVYPSIADSITMLLDGSTGDSYSQHYKNVNTRIADVQSKTKQPIYSSLGTYSLILPVEDIITSLSYRFATDLLGEHLLDLRPRTTDAGQTRNVLYHESDARKDAATFLRAPRSSSGVVSTNFIQLTPAVVDSWKARAEAAINEIAARGAPELLTWILPPETDPAIEAITRKVREDLEVTLASRVLLSSGEGDDPIEGSNRIQRGVREFRAAQLGRDVDGRYVGGLYRTALEQCAAVHRERYRKLLAEHMLNLLNGPDPRNKDYQREKRGKLGQAQDLLTQLARYFTELSAALSQIKSHRVALDELRGAQEEAALYRLEMDAKKSKKGPLGILVKNWQPAVQAQRSYIDAEWRVIEIEIKDLFFDVLQQISDMLRAATEEYKTAVDTWIATLAHGATGALADPGLYRHLQRAAAQHTANREDKKRIGVHEYLTDDDYENELYRGVTQGKFADALTQLVWEIEPQRDAFRLVLRGCNSLGVSPADGRSATERNAEFLLNIARDFCAPLRDLTIADRLVEREVGRLASTLLDKCGPMIRYDPAKTGGEQETHFFICVNEGGQKAYFNEFRSTLRRLGTSARDNQILASANPYICTILATADVIASPSLLAYTSAEREYNNYAGDARLLHVFPAEVNAVQLEQQLPSIREPRRRFSPILTAMLEDRGTVDLFILAYLYRLLRLEDSGGVNGSRWVLFVPASPIRGEERFALTPPDRRPSLCEAMERFVFHRSDINNPTHKIDLLALEHALRKHEGQASGGDESRLINLLESTLAEGIESLRTSPDVNLRDIASLMRLVVEEIVQGLFDRVRASGKHYDPDAAPLVQMVMQHPARAPKPTSNGHSGMPGGMQANGAASPQKAHAPTATLPVTESAAGSARDKLRQLKELLDDGLIVPEEYEAKRRRLIVTGGVRGQAQGDTSTRCEKYLASIVDCRLGTASLNSRYLQSTIFSEGKHMQVGDIIKGIKGEAAGIAYLVMQPIGAPGLFGQAFVCRRTDDNSEAVVKTLRAGRPHADRERFFQEAATLERVADFEQRAGKHYAVRLLDHSAPDANETFLVLERASGQNVQDDMLRQIVDWRHAPLDEHLALQIARQLAQALQIAHQAGMCYDDMKLDNLFWDHARPNDPLRIIDWNVTSSVAERGVAGDWARFGARLYELCTGERIGVNRDGTILGEWPAGACWQQLAEGVRDIISQALGLRYTDDAPLLRDLKRECEQARMAWPELLERATIADGAGQTIDVLAPIARAERLIQQLPANDPSREAALAHCADLRQRATLRRGIASSRALDYAIQSLARNEPKLAVERLQKAYAETGSRDPRPRRWLWVARFAAEHAQRYRAVREDLEAAVDALNHGNPQLARDRLILVGQADPDLPIADWLQAEAESMLAAADGSAGNGVFKHEQLRAVIDQYPDLRALRDEIQQRHAELQRRQAALLREQELWASAQRTLEEATHAEQHGQDEQALLSCARALAALDQILTEGCTPAIEAAAREMQRQLTEQRERLDRQVLARQLPERARSPDPHQRAEALRLAEEHFPDWAELPQLREQLRQIDAELTIVERAQIADPAIGSEQTLAALDTLEHAGVRLDRSGADLRLARKTLTERRNAQRNSQARARAREASLAIDEARAQLSRAKCEAVLRGLQSLDSNDIAAETRAEVERALRHATDLLGLLERVDQQRSEIARHYAANNLSYACRLSQRLARDNPQLPRLAEEATDHERDLWRWIATGAHELAAAYRRLSLKAGTAQQLSQLDVEAARIATQRQAADEPIALVATQREPLRLDADSALAALAEAREEWELTRTSSLAELSRYLDQAKAAADHGDDGAARQTLLHIREAYLPADAREQGLEPIVIRVERLAHELKQRRDSQLAQLHQLEARLNDPGAQLWFEELTEPFKDGSAMLDPEIVPVWEHVREHAEQLRQQLVRVSWKDQVASQERLDRLEALLVALGQAGAVSHQQDELHGQQLRELIERGEQADRRQIMAIEAEHQQTTALLETHRNILLGAFAAQFIFMLAFIVIIVRFG